MPASGPASGAAWASSRCPFNRLAHALSAQET